MSNFFALLATELKFQWRHGFVIAAIVVTAVWAALLTLLEADARPFWFGIIAAIDVSSIGLIFGFGLGVLDKNQAAILAVRLTPAPSWVAGLARVVSLTLLVTGTLLLLALMTLTMEQTLNAIVGVTLCAFFFSSLGVTSARRFTNVNQFMIFFALSGMVWALPILYYAGLVASPLWLFLPSSGSVMLLQATFQSLSATLIISLISVQLLWFGIIFYLGEHWAHISFNHRFGGH